jgi:hypothetical protein
LPALYLGLIWIGECFVYKFLCEALTKVST